MTCDVTCDDSVEDWSSGEEKCQGEELLERKCVLCAVLR